WVNPDNRVNYRVAVQTPDYRISTVDQLLNTPIIRGQASGTAQLGSSMAGTVSAPPPPQLLSNVVDLKRATSPANVNHYNVQPVYDVFANVQGRDLSAVARDVQTAIDTVRPELPRCSTIVMPGQVETVNNSFA